MAHELPIYLDSTMISTFRSCMKKGFWNYLAENRVGMLEHAGALPGLVPPGENIHFIAGGSFAKVMDLARKFQFASVSRLDHEDLCELLYPYFAREWGEFVAPEDHAKTFYNVWFAVEEYLRRYHPYDDPVRPISLATGPASEFSFAIPIPVDHPSGMPFLYCGKFDLLGEYFGRTTVLDDKTTGYFTPHWQKQWTMRGQFIGYVWACQRLGFDTSDCIVRGTAIQKTGIFFQDLPLSFPKHVIDRWFEELCLTAERLKQYAQAEYWPYDFADACSSYGGCPYMDLCTVKDPENWINNYQARTWSPIALEDAT